jgi:hypothetical protein
MRVALSSCAAHQSPWAVQPHCGQCVATAVPLPAATETPSCPNQAGHHLMLNPACRPGKAQAACRPSARRTRPLRIPASQPHRAAAGGGARLLRPASAAAKHSSPSKRGNPWCADGSKAGQRQQQQNPSGPNQSVFRVRAVCDTPRFDMPLVLGSLRTRSRLATAVTYAGGRYLVTAASGVTHATQARVGVCALPVLVGWGGQLASAGRRRR